MVAWPGLGRAQDKQLKIVILEGEGAFNDMKHRVARNPVVEVRDESGRPVPGAQVTFSLPEIGPGGTFAGGSKKFTVTTDAQGRAAAEGLKPNAIEGRFHTRVTATAAGVTGSIAISQRNTLAGGFVEVRKGGIGKGKIVLLLLLIAGAGGGAYAALH
jgi:hypothetical protein